MKMRSFSTRYCGATNHRSKEGYLNIHNLHRWQLENLHIMHEDRSQYQFKIIYWTGILNGQIIGPFELPGNLDGPSYLSFLQNDLPGL